MMQVKFILINDEVDQSNNYHNTTNSKRFNSDVAWNVCRNWYNIRWNLVLLWPNPYTLVTTRRIPNQIVSTKKKHFSSNKMVLVSTYLLAMIMTFNIPQTLNLKNPPYTPHMFTTEVTQRMPNSTSQTQTNSTTLYSCLSYSPRMSISISSCFLSFKVCAISHIKNDFDVVWWIMIKNDGF